MILRYYVCCVCLVQFLSIGGGCDERQVIQLLSESLVSGAPKYQGEEENGITGNGWATGIDIPSSIRREGPLSAAGNEDSAASVQKAPILQTRMRNIQDKLRKSFTDVKESTIADCVPLKAAKQSQPIEPSKLMYEQNNRPSTTQSEGQDKGLKRKMTGILMKSWKSLSRKNGASFRSNSSQQSKASKFGGAVKSSSFKISGIRLPGLNRLLSLGRKSRKTIGDDQSQASQKSFDPHIFSEDETLLTVRPELPATPSLKPLQPSVEPSPLRLPSPARRSPTPSPARRSPMSSPEASFKAHTPPEIAILQTTSTDFPPVSPQHSPRAKPDSPPRSQSSPSSASTSTSSTPTASPRSESRVSPQPPRFPPFPMEPPSPDPTPTPPRPKSPSPSPRSGSKTPPPSSSPRSGSKTPPPSPSPRSGSKTPPPSPSPRSGSKPPPPSQSLPSSTLKPQFQFPDRVQAPPAPMPPWRAMPPTKAAPPWRATSGTWQPPLPIPPTTGARSSMPTEPTPQRYQPPRRSRTPNWREELGGNCETTFAKDGEVPYWYRKHE